MINPGMLRKRISVQEEHRTQNEIGESVIEWVPRFDLWCKIEPTRGSEKFASAQWSNDITHIITCRYNDQIHQENQLVYADRVLRIEAILNHHEFDELMIITCVEDVERQDGR